MSFAGLFAANALTLYIVMVGMEEFRLNVLPVFLIDAVGGDSGARARLFCLCAQRDMAAVKIGPGPEHEDGQGIAVDTAQQVDVMGQDIAELEVELAIGYGCIETGRDVA